MVQDQPDDYIGTAPAYSHRKTDQTLDLSSEDYVIAPAGSQVNTLAVAYTNLLFNLDTVHIRTDARGLQRYTYELLIGPAPGAYVFVIDQYYEHSATFRVMHATGTGFENVIGERETIYNNSAANRFFRVIRIKLTAPASA